MNKIEINDEFLKEPLLKYDAGAIILEDMISLFGDISPEDKKMFEELIEWTISDLITFLSLLLEDTPNEEFYSYRLYETIYWIFYHLKNKWLVSEEDIKYLWESTWINDFPISKKWIQEIKKEVSYYTTFYLANWNDKKWMLENKARQYYNIKDYQAAISIQLEVINNYNGNYTNYVFIWDCFATSWDYEEALKYYFKASYWHPDNKRQYDSEKWIYSHLWLNKYPLKIWNAYYNLWNYSKALISYLNCEDISKVWINMLWDLWGKLCEKWEIILAIKAFKKMLMLDSSNYNAVAYLWLCYYKLSKYDEAIIYFKEALILDNNNENAYKNLYTSYCEIWDYISAKKVLEKLVNQFPNKEEHKDQLAVITKEIENQESKKKTPLNPNKKVWVENMVWYFW